MRIIYLAVFMAAFFTIAAAVGVSADDSEGAKQEQARGLRVATNRNSEDGLMMEKEDNAFWRRFLVVDTGSFVTDVPTQAPTPDPRAQSCLDSGGTLTTGICCLSVDAFPNTCLIGSCGCPPDSSHEIQICSCPDDLCFDGTECTNSEPDTPPDPTLPPTPVTETPAPVPDSPGPTPAPVPGTPAPVPDTPAPTSPPAPPDTPTQAPTPDPRAQSCLDSGGMLTTGICCLSVDAFPNTCLIGSCGCPPDSSHEIQICSCPDDLCFDGTECTDSEPDTPPDPTLSPTPETGTPAPTSFPDAPAPTSLPDAPAPTSLPDAPAPTSLPDAPAPTSLPDAPAPTSLPDAPAPTPAPDSPDPTPAPVPGTPPPLAPTPLPDTQATTSDPVPGTPAPSSPLTQCQIRVETSCTVDGVPCSEIEGQTDVQCAGQGRFTELTFRYIPGDCFQSTTFDPRFECKDSLEVIPTEANIVCQGARDNETLFNGIVEAGAEIDLRLDGVELLPADTTCSIFETSGPLIQTFTFHSSGSSFFALQEIFGSLQLLGCEGSGFSKQCLATTNYVYTVFNDGSGPMEVTFLTRTRDGETKDLLPLLSATEIRAGDSALAEEEDEIDTCVDGTFETTVTSQCEPLP